MSELNYTSRSAAACYQECHRRRLLQYLLDGTGYVPLGANVYLSTGISIHKGVEYLLRALKSNPEDFIWDKPHMPIRVNHRETAVGIATSCYQELAKNGIIGGKLGSSKEIQDYTYKEQISLVEALVRAWYYRELPLISKRFKVSAVELDTNSVLVQDPMIILEGKADALLQDKESKDLYVYSLKSVREFGWSSEKSYKTDLQGITEVWLTQNYLKRLKESKPKYRGITTRVMGVKFCFLIKGPRYEDKDEKGKGTGLWRTSNSLISGYRKFEVNRLEYAHSYWFENPQNKSGKGRLGKGWEGFNSWEVKELGVKKWMDLLARKQVQPESGDIIKKYVVTPEEYWRNTQEVQDTIAELQVQESRIVKDLEFIGKLAEDEKMKMLKSLFPRYRGSCWYPQDCDYTEKGRICRDIEDFRELIESREFVARIPHHKLELVQLQSSGKGD